GDLAIIVSTSAEAQVLVRRPRVAVGARVVAAAIRVDAPAEAEVGAVVGGEDVARVVFVDLELRRRDLVEVLHLARGPRVGRVRDGTHQHATTMKLNVRSVKARRAAAARRGAGRGCASPPPG